MRSALVYGSIFLALLHLQNCEQFNSTKPERLVMAKEKGILGKIGEGINKAAETILDSALNSEQDQTADGKSLQDAAAEHNQRRYDKPKPGDNPYT